jgi:hypothetical protein
MIDATARTVGNLHHHHRPAGGAVNVDRAGLAAVSAGKW